MNSISVQWPEYKTVMSIFGIGRTYGLQRVAEIGDTRHFRNLRVITASAGLDDPTYQSGTVNIKSRSISKRGSSALRKTLFQITEVYLLTKPENEPVYQLLDKKCSEGKHCYSYRIAAANKLLRIYLAKVNAMLIS